MMNLADFIQYPFLTHALIGTLLVSVLCGLFSPLIIAKRYAYIGEALSHSTFMSHALSFLFAAGTASYITQYSITLGITLILATFLAWGTYKSKIPSDTLIGIFLTSTLALGVVFFSLWGGNNGTLSDPLFGNILFVTTFDLISLAVLLVLSLLCLWIPYKQWIFTCYDEKGAQVSGISTIFFHFFLIYLLTFLIVSSIRIAGTLLVNALLLIPGAFAYRFTSSMKNVFLTSLIFSVTTCLMGLVWANELGIAPGASLALTQFLFFILFIVLEKIFSLKRN